LIRTRPVKIVFSTRMVKVKTMEQGAHAKILASPPPEAHLCAQCGKRLNCPNARLRKNPCDCSYPSLALVSVDNPNEESEVFFCNAEKCRQWFLQDIFSFSDDD